MRAKKMSTEIIVAIIGLVGSAIGTLGGIIITNRLTTYRIGQLEKKVDKHNNLIERTYKVEEDIAVINERIESTNEKVGTLEKFLKGISR